MNSLNQDGLPELESLRLLLKIPMEDDIDQVIAFFDRNKDFLKSTSPTPAIDFNTRSYWESTLSDNRIGFRGGRSVKLFIFYKTKQGLAIIGEVNFSQIFRGVFLACKLGYKIDREYQGKGLMKEALQRSIQFCFEELKLHRIEANYMPNNDRSAGILHSLGFTIEGKAKNYLKINGKWEDHILTSLCNDLV
ncbi:MAG: GNAT family N-acetyltransferase [Candidatus Cloacimonetes bacterium]|nr:GNAT family N-acetyltransferase [Candidatus Cloacimonadota bacterium]